MSRLAVAVYSNGRVFDGAEGITFEGDHVTMHIKSGIEYERLKAKIHSKLRLYPNQLVSRIVSRYMICDNPVKYIMIEITDDRDVECMLNGFHQNSRMSTLELYADVNVLGGCRFADLGSYAEDEDDEDQDWASEMEVESDEDDDEDDIPTSGSSDTEEEAEQGSNIFLSEMAAPRIAATLLYFFND